MAKMMRLMSMKQYSKMTKARLVRKIMKALKKMPKMKLAKLCYELEKSRLPTISTTKKGMPRLTARRKAFTKKTKAKTKTKTKKRKLRAGVYIKNINGVMRKFRVMQNGQWRFMKMSPSMASTSRAKRI
jgi:hypothetical protein